MQRPLELLEQDYLDIPIPPALDEVVSRALKGGGRRPLPYGRITAAAAAAVLLACVLGVNLSPALARTLGEMPVLGPIVQVFTFREYRVEGENFGAEIKVPAVTNLEDEALEARLNAKYLEEGRALYESFMAEMEQIREQGDGRLRVDSGYLVKTDNERLLSIGRYVVKSMGSAMEVLEYDTIDKKNKLLLTLPMLFKDDGYIDVISRNIKQQMLEQMKAGEGKIYWVEGAGLDDSIEPFESIAADQDFYINEDGKLVISFDEYEVGPGVMGVVEFIIPTEVIEAELVSREYIR